MGWDGKSGDGLVDALSPTLPAVEDLDAVSPPLLQDAADEGRPTWLRLNAQVTEVSGDAATRYARGAELARGGIGRVLSAQDRHLQRDIAIKELLDANAPPTTVQRFVREAQITGQLQHPGVVPVYDLGRRPDGTLFIAMKRIHGSSLEEALSEQPDLAARLRYILHFRKACDAVAFAHSRGVVHRDLKPANIMLGEFGETLVVDWGLAKIVDAPEEPQAPTSESQSTVPQNSLRTERGHAVGTPSYMSPEQARGELESVDERSDVWSLGAILFQILTGRPPFIGDALAVVDALRSEAAPRVLEITPEAPVELAAVVDRALSRTRESRYAAVHQLSDDVDAWIEDRQVHAYEYSGWERLKRFARRHRNISLTLGLAILTGLIVGAVAWQQYARERVARTVVQSRRAGTIAERDQAIAASRASREQMANALIERAEAALDRSAHGTAALWAAAALNAEPESARWLDPRSESPRTERERDAELRVARAAGLLEEADARRVFVFERYLQDATAPAAISPDRTRLAWRQGDGVRIHDLRRAASENRSIPEGEVAGLSSSGDVLLLGTEAGLYDRTGDRLVALPSSTTSAGLLDRMLLATADGALLRIPRPGTAPEPSPTALTDERWQVRASRGSALLFGPSGVSVLSPALDQEWPTIVIDAGVQAAALSPDGRHLALLAEGELRTATRENPRAQRLAFVDATHVDWLSERVMLTASSEVVRARHRRTGAVLEELAIPGTSDFQLWGATGERIVVVPGVHESGAARLFRRRSGPHLHSARLPNEVQSLAMDPVRRRVIVTTSRGTFALSLDRTERLSARRALDALTPELGFPRAAAVARTDGAIATVTSRGAILLREMDGGAPRVIQPAWHPGSTERASAGAVFDRGGTRLFFAGPEGTVIGYDRTANRRVATLSTADGEVNDLALSPDGTQLAAASETGLVRIWRLPELEPTHTFTSYTNGAKAVAFSPDGRRIATGDGAGRVQILVLDTRAVAVERRAYSSAVRELRWTADGDTVIATADVPQVRLFHGESLRLMRCLKTRRPPRGIGVATESSAVVFGTGSRVVWTPRASATRTLQAPLALARAQTRAGVELLDGRLRMASPDGLAPETSAE